MKLREQTTLGREVDIAGVGVHSGTAVRLILRPAPVDAGVSFIDSAGEQRLRVQPDAVASTDLSTLIGDRAGFHVSTVEHLMSGLAGGGIDNLEIEISGSEVPILDGSAIEFIERIDAAGIVGQKQPVRAIRVLEPVRVEAGAAWAEFVPYDGSRYEIEIDFSTPAIGNQKISFDLTPKVYRRDIAPARTFGFMRDVERLWAAGLALGSSLENSVVIGEDDRIVNSEGLRFADEFVRHKALDAVGDIAVAGLAVIGCYRSSRAGHKLNAAALRALLDQPHTFLRL